MNNSDLHRIELIFNPVEYGIIKAKYELADDFKSNTFDANDNIIFAETLNPTRVTLTRNLYTQDVKLLTRVIIHAFYSKL